MRLQILSDLHFEFHADGGREFVAGLDPSGVDALVLAGDIATVPYLRAALRAICERYSEAHVVWVHGNHEFYASDRPTVIALSERAMRENANLEWLDGRVISLHGRRILGAPLWFSEQPEAAPYRAAMSDFHVIRGFEGWVYAENARARAFFEHELQPGDVAVTHHLPARRSIAPEFEASALNPFFLCDVEPLLRDRRPALWVHGHTHVSTDYVIGATRVVCNPFGYARAGLNPRFSEKLVIDV